MTASMLKGIDACMDREAFASAATLILAYMDTLGSFYKGGGASPSNFGDFVEDYMSVVGELISKLGMSREGARHFLHDKFRNGAIHEYLSKAGTGYIRFQEYITLKGGSVFIGIWKFRDDFASAIDKFRKDVVDNKGGIGDSYNCRAGNLRGRGKNLFLNLPTNIKSSGPPESIITGQTSATTGVF